MRLLILAPVLLCIVFLPRRLGHPLGWAVIGMLFLVWGISGYRLPLDGVQRCAQSLGEDACLAVSPVVLALDGFARGGFLFAIILVGIALGFSATRKPQTEPSMGLWRRGLLAIAGAAIAGGVFAEATWLLQGAERAGVWHFSLAGGGALAATSLALLPAMRPAALAGGGTWLVLLAYSLWIYPIQVISGAAGVANGQPFCVGTLQSDASISARADLSLLTHPKRRHVLNAIGRTIREYYSSRATGLSMVFHDLSQENSASDGLAWAHWQPFRGWIVPKLNENHTGMWSANCHLDTNWAETLPRGSDLELTAQAVKSFFENGNLVGRHVKTLEFTIPSNLLPRTGGSGVTMWVDASDLMPLEKSKTMKVLEHPQSPQSRVFIRWGRDPLRLDIIGFERYVQSGGGSYRHSSTIAGCEDFCGISTIVDIGPAGPLSVSYTFGEAYKSIEDLGDWEAKANVLRSFAQRLITGP